MDIICTHVWMKIGKPSESYNILEVLCGCEREYRIELNRNEMKIKTKHSLKFAVVDEGAKAPSSPQPPPPPTTTTLIEKVIIINKKNT